MGYTHVFEKTEAKSPIYSKPGRMGGTFAHVILALAYAEYLNPDLGIEVREIALRVWGGDITVLDDFARSRSAQVQEDGNRLMAREEIKRHNFELNARVRDAGGKRQDQYAAFHNAGYRGLYNGLDENAIHRRKGLKKDQAILDFMGSEELAANLFRTTQAHRKLRYEPVRTVKEACDVHHKTGERVRAFIEETAGPMPEDMPVVDGIAEARRRLKDYRKGREPAKKLPSTAR